MNQDVFKKAMTQSLTVIFAVIAIITMVLPFVSVEAFRDTYTQSLFQMAWYVDVLSLLALLGVIGVNALLISKVSRNLPNEGLARKTAQMSAVLGTAALLLGGLFVFEGARGLSNLGIGFYLFVIANGLLIGLSVLKLMGKDAEMISKAQGMAGNMAKKVDTMTNEPSHPTTPTA